MLRTLTSLIIMPANNSIAGFVKCYGPPTSPTNVPANDSIAGILKWYGPDTAHKGASKRQYCWLH